MKQTLLQTGENQLCSTHLIRATVQRIRVNQETDNQHLKSQVQYQLTDLQRIVSQAMYRFTDLQRLHQVVIFALQIWQASHYTTVLLTEQEK